MQLSFADTEEPLHLPDSDLALHVASASTHPGKLDSLQFAPPYSRDTESPNTARASATSLILNNF
jgi:hypothetical protein